MSDSIIPFIPFAFFAAFLLFGIVSIVFAMRASRKRQQALTELALKHGFVFPAQCRTFDNPRLGFQLFERGRQQRIFECMQGTVNGLPFEYFVFKYQTGSGKSRRHHELSVIAITDQKFSLPPFSLSPEGVFDKIAGALGWPDINFPHQPEFSSRFRLKSTEESAVRSIFTPQLMQELLSRGSISIEGCGDTMLFYVESQVLPVDGISSAIEECLVVKGLFSAPKMEATS